MREIFEQKLREIKQEFERLDLPEYMFSGLKLYLCSGINPGSFLSAILENDLQGAFGYADHNNQRMIHNWTRLLYSHIPSDAKGSREKVFSWCVSDGWNGLLGDVREYE